MEKITNYGPILIRRGPYKGRIGYYDDTDMDGKLIIYPNVPIYCSAYYKVSQSVATSVIPTAYLAERLSDIDHELYKNCSLEHLVKSHIVYRLCNHMVYTLSLIQPGVIVQEIALFECVNSLVQVDAADSELSEHQCDLPRERRLANGDAFPTKPFA